MKKRRIERDSLRDRERLARAQMSSQGSDLQETVPMFRPPIKVQPAESDHTHQQIRRRFGDYSIVKHLLDDPKSSIGVYTEPASPAPCGPLRGTEFKKPHYASSQNGRPHQQIYQNNGKFPDAPSINVSKKPLPKLHIDKTSPNFEDPGEMCESILKEMKLIPLTPVTQIAATPRKEPEVFNFNGLTTQRPLENIQTEPKLTIQTKNYIDRHAANPRLSSTDLEKDLRLTDSEDETRKKMHPENVIQSGGATSSGSESTHSDSDSDSSSDDDSKINGNHSPAASPTRHDPDEPPEVVEGPGETRPSWGLKNFVPQPTASVFKLSPKNNSRSSPIKNSKLSPRLLSPNVGLRNGSPRRDVQPSPRNNHLGENKLSISSTAPGSNTSSSSNHSANNVESDSCSDSTKKIKNLLAETKRTDVLLSGLSDSDDGSASGNENPAARMTPLVGSNSERTLANSRVGSRSVARRSPRTSVRRPPASSPSGSEDEAPPRPPRPDPEKRKGRGRPRKPRTEEDAVKRRRGRPPKQKSRPPPTSSEDEHPSSPTVNAQWHYSDSEYEHTVADKEKNNILGKLFSSVGGAKGGGKGGAKGGKGKGQVMIIEAHSHEHDKDEDVSQRRLKEESVYNRRVKEEEKKLKEEEALRKAREEEILAKRKREEEIRRSKEEMNLKRVKDDDPTNLRRLKEEEELRRKNKEEEALQRRLKDEERRKKESELLLQRRCREEEFQKQAMLRRQEEEIQRKLKEEELAQKRLKECEPSPRRVNEDALQRRLREDGLSQRRFKYEDNSEATNRHNTENNLKLMVHIDLRRLSTECADRLVRTARPLKRLPPPPPAPPDKRQKVMRENPETTPTNHERFENIDNTRLIPPQVVYYSYLEKGHQDCSSDEESRDHKYYLSEATRLRAAAERESDPLRRVMLYQESVLCFVLTGRVLESELDTKKAFTMYRETLEYIKSIHSMPGRSRASPATTLTKLDVLSYRCQALLCLRMFKMYKKEVKEYNKILQEYQQKPQAVCLEPIGTVSPLSPTPSPASSVGSVGSAGSNSSGYGSGSSGNITVTPQHTPGSSSTTTTTASTACVAMPANVNTAMGQLVKYYTFLHKSHDLWDQADTLIRESQGTDLFVRVDKMCGPLTLHSSFRHLVKYVRHAIHLLKSLGRHNT